MTQIQEFQKMLNHLNAAQRVAVEKIDGPVMVVAGPGTGKTQVLAARIANILTTTDTQPHNILALTFTDSAAKNMQERVVKLIGKAGYYVHITTFHAFCKSIIDSYPEYFPIARGSQAVTLLEQYELIERLIIETPLEALKPLNDPLFYTKEIISSISQLKREGFSTEEFEKIVTEEFADDMLLDLKKTELQKKLKQKNRNHELAVLYKKYEEEIRKQKRFDFDDMISLVKHAFSEHELLLREQQEKYLYFLVDEYQDTNSAQNNIVFQLASYWENNPNLFVVGDPHQSIYRFQGASLENVFGFMQRYTDTTIITLKIGYRCPQNIYDSAFSLITNNDLTNPEYASPDSPRTKLLSAVSQPLQVPEFRLNIPESVPVIGIYSASNQVSELLFITNRIQQLLDEGVEPREIAILYRKNNEAGELGLILSKMGINYQIGSGVNVLGTESIRQLITFMQVIRDMRTGQENDNQLFEIMCYEWIPVNNLAALKGIRLASLADAQFSQMIIDEFPLIDKDNRRSLLYNGAREKLSETELLNLKTFIAQLQEWSISDNQKVFTQWFETLLNESGYLTFILTQVNHLQLVTNLNSFFNSIKELVNQNHNYKLDNFLQTLSVMDQHSISITAQDIAIVDGAITLSTVHKAKGMEWQYVFIMHCNDKAWGNSSKRELIKLPESLLQNTDLSKKERNEDDRRLFYVAITRAKKQVLISYPTTLVTGSLKQDVLPSMFIGELGNGDKIDYQPDSMEAQITALLQPSLKVSPPSEEAFFSELVQDFSLSVTSLNKYVSDPLAFKYDVLLRVPKAKLEHMVFGTAMHAALEQLMREVKEKQSQVNLGTVFDRYEHALKSEAMAINDYERRLNYGKNALQIYWESIQQSPFPDIFQLEQNIGSGLHTALLDDIKLNGRLDRLDWIDRNKKELRVVDYKTGKARSKNEIEAKTLTSQKKLSEREQYLPESIRGPYKRQLLFYKLLAEQDPNFKPTIVQGVFDFVEPDKETGKCTTHAFDLHDTDVDDLKELVRQVMKEIRSLQFLYTDATQ